MALTERLQKLSLNDTAVDTVVGTFSEKTLLTIYRSDCASELSDYAEGKLTKAKIENQKRKDQKKSLKPLPSGDELIPPMTHIKERILQNIDFSSGKAILECADTDLLRTLLAPANINHGDNKLRKVVFSKRLGEQFKSHGTLTYLMEHFAEDKDALMLLGDKIAAPFKEKDSVKTIRESVTKQLSILGLELYLSSLPLDVLNEIAIKEKILKDRSTSVDRLVEALITHKEPEKRVIERKEVLDLEPKKGERKKPLPIASSSEWGLLNNYNVDELKAFCRKKNLKIGSKKADVVKIILAFQNGGEDKENVMATNKMMEARTRMEGKKKSEKSGRKSSKKEEVEEESSEEEEEEKEEEKEEAKTVEKKKTVVRRKAVKNSAPEEKSEEGESAEVDMETNKAEEEAAAAKEKAEKEKAAKEKAAKEKAAAEKAAKEKAAKEKAAAAEKAEKERIAKEKAAAAEKAEKEKSEEKKSKSKKTVDTTVVEERIVEEGEEEGEEIEYIEVSQEVSQDEGKDEEEEVNLEELFKSSLAEIKEFCKTEGINVKNCKSKKDYCDAIEAHYSVEQ